MTEFTLREAREKSGFSLRKAAELLGISHAYLSGLELGHKPLHDDRTSEMKRVYGMRSQDSLVQPLPQDKVEFLDWLKGQIKWWDSRFVLPRIPAVSRLISDISVDPSFIFEDGTPASKREILKELFSNKENSALLLQGNMGTGKSFFLRMLTLEIDKMCNDLKLKEKYVPILISLGEFQLDRGSLLPSIVQHYKEHGFSGSAVQLEQFFRQCFDRGNALLLFDGLDEIQDHAKRVEMLALLQQSFEDVIRKNGSRMIITGREDAFFERDRSYKSFRLIKMEQWHSLQMYEACVKWSFEEEADTSRFFNVLQANDTLHRLAKWPLLFHLLTTLHSASGLKPFQELTGLYDDCCQVLENTWDSARRTFHRQSGVSQDPLEMHPWLKWRHFLIHLMASCLKESDGFAPTPKFTFTGFELKDAWETFLTSKGVSRESLDFARLEDLISNQDRIGPMFQYREIQRGEDSPRFRESFSFLDPIFGYYYYSKALINDPKALESFVVTNLRSPEWEDVIPLAIEELGRSERSYENEIGEELVSAILESDDEFSLDKGQGLGKFSLFMAARSIQTYNLDRYWESVIEPFVEAYMNTIFERDGTIGIQILGEYTASAKLRTHFLELFKSHFESEDLSEKNDEDKWQILAALGRFGEKTDFIVDELLDEISQVTKEKQDVNIVQRINLRRVLVSIREIRGIFTLEEDGGQSESQAKTVRIERIQKGIHDLFAFALRDFKRSMQSSDFRNVTYWDVLTVGLDTQSLLRYHHSLRKTVNDSVKLIVPFLDERILEYPARRNLIQFLKAATRHSYVLDGSLSKNFMSALEGIEKELSYGEQQDLLACKYLLENRHLLSERRLDRGSLFEKTYGPVSESEYGKFVETLKKQGAGKAQDHLEVGLATSGIMLFHDQIDFTKSEYSDDKVVQVLLNALECEMNIDESVRDGERTYTAPFTNYGFPLYDHIYTAAVKLARALPISRSKKEHPRLSS